MECLASLALRSAFRWEPNFRVIESKTGRLRHIGLISALTVGLISASVIISLANEAYSFNDERVDYAHPT